jgi:putative addiction module CopG family antidote
MRSTKQMSITLPLEMAQMVKDKVAKGEYATESEVIRDGLRALLARDRAVDAWLRQQVAPVYDAMSNDPSRGKSLDQVRARLARAAAEHETDTAS